MVVLSDARRVGATGGGGGNDFLGGTFIAYLMFLLRFYFSWWSLKSRGNRFGFWQILDNSSCYLSSFHIRTLPMYVLLHSNET